MALQSTFLRENAPPNTSQGLLSVGGLFACRLPPTTRKKSQGAPRTRNRCALLHGQMAKVEQKGPSRKLPMDLGPLTRGSAVSSFRYWPQTRGHTKYGEREKQAVNLLSSDVMYETLGQRALFRSPYGGADFGECTSTTERIGA